MCIKLVNCKEYTVVYVKSSCARNRGLPGVGAMDVSGGMHSYVPNFGIWCGNDQFHVLVNLLTGKESPCYHLSRRLFGPKSQSGSFWRYKNFGYTFCLDLRSQVYLKGRFSVYKTVEECV